MDKFKVGYTTGVYDLFHIGHLNLLKRAKEHCDYLIVGVTTDEVCEKSKNKKPVISFEDRSAIVEAIKYVDRVVPQTGYDLEDKMNAWQELKFDAVFVGSDWQGTEKWNEIEKAFAKKGVTVCYLPHTDGISSSILRDKT
ncbi:MAG: adenylyltransferase/cytidyltransferase family protein [Clostridiales bacterium]|nr:adenylyltransferase/cytidyltransferase family protein [Clostridiales bacterium]